MKAKNWIASNRGFLRGVANSSGALAIGVLIGSRPGTLWVAIVAFAISVVLEFFIPRAGSNDVIL